MPGIFLVFWGYFLGVPGFQAGGKFQIFFVGIPGPAISALSSGGIVNCKQNTQL